MTYTIKCCGPSKDYFDEEEIIIETDTTLTPSKLKPLLLEEIHDGVDKQAARALLNASMIATDNTVLQADSAIEKNTLLFLLPPVCGG